MSTSTNVSHLKINKMTQATYNTITPSDTELYVVTDGTYTISSSEVTTALGYTPENVANKVTTITSSSTDSQYPSAKSVYDAIQAGGGGSITVDQTYNASSSNAQSGVAIAGAGFLQVKGAITSSTVLISLEEGIYTIDGVTHTGFPDSSQTFYGVLIQYGGTYKPQLLVAGIPSAGGLYHRRYLTGSSAFTNWVRCGNSATGSNSFSMGGTPVASSGGTVVGIEATTSANYGTSFGYKAKCTASSTVAIGRVSTASGAFSVAIGYGATVSSAGGKSIQLGFGTNSTTTSLSVGFQDVGNYQLLDGTTGKIPNDRLNISTTLSASSTDTEFVSAKCVYDILHNAGLI